MNNRRKEFKSRLNNRELVYGSWVTSSDPMIAELLATLLQPSVVVVDIEHSTISLEAAKNIFAVVQAKGCCAMPRLPSHDSSVISRLMDAGADGLIAPMVSNKEELEQIVKAMKYPPTGARGYGYCRAQEYSGASAEYYGNWNSSSTLIIMIETIEGLNNVEELASHPDVDGILVGQIDLSGILGNTPGDPSSPEVQAAVEKVSNCCKKYGKSCALIVGDVNKETLQATQQKANLVVLSMDIFILVQWIAGVKKLIS